MGNVFYHNSNTFSEILIFTGQHSSSLQNQMQEETFPLQNYDSTAKTECIILSVISGVVPGTIVQNQPITADGNLSVAYYTSLTDSSKPVYDWLAVDPLAHNDAEFQHGVARLDYDVFEKCVNITFTQVSLYASMYQ